jgi:16S rRNA (cytidine1402-2'-O)-methyltransferase
VNGALYLVATPIGNLDDITLRALKILREADLIACEDTRHSRKLLSHFDIHRPTVSYYRENEASRGAELIARLQAGESVALITDAGAPVWSDPGARLVASALAAGIAVVPVPGASAVVTAWMAGGIEADTVTFAGFLPARTGERRQVLRELLPVPGALIFFEAAQRLAAALMDIAAVLGPARRAAIGRELTKLHEEFHRGTVAELRDAAILAPTRGEITLVVGPPSAEAPPPPDEIEAQLIALARRPEANVKAALKALARSSGLSRSELYRRWQQAGRE